MGQLIQIAVEELKSYDCKGSWYRRCGYYGAKVFAAGVELNTEIGSVFRHAVAQHDLDFFADVIETGIGSSAPTPALLSIPEETAFVSSKFDKDEDEEIASNVYEPSLLSIKRTPSALNLLAVVRSWKGEARTDRDCLEFKSEMEEKLEWIENEENKKDVKEGASVVGDENNNFNATLCEKVGSEGLNGLVSIASDLNKSINSSNVDRTISASNMAYPEKENEVSQGHDFDPEYEDIHRSPSQILSTPTPTIPLAPILLESEEANEKPSVKDERVAEMGEEDEAFGEIKGEERAP
uniref:Uncharacterized protein n=1 Tax=Palpitomonas bilix TaxID=652834 RepID=A0A7S3DIQ8_9EUKA